MSMSLFEKYKEQKMRIKYIIATIFLLFIYNCSHIHPPLSMETYNKSKPNKKQQVLTKLKANAKNNKGLVQGSVSILPFEESGQKTGLGLAASEFFTSNLAMFSQFTMIDRSYTNILAEEYKNYSPKKKQQILRAEQMVDGMINMEEEKLSIQGFCLREAKQIPIGNKAGHTRDFFRLVADLNIAFLQNNGIVVTDEIARKLYEIPTENIEAYILYAKGRYEESIGNLEAALEAYQKAKQKDPNFEKPRQREQELRDIAINQPPGISDSEDRFELDNELADDNGDDLLNRPLDQKPHLEERYIPPAIGTGTVIIDFELPEQVNP